MAGGYDSGCGLLSYHPIVSAGGGVRNDVANPPFGGFGRCQHRRGMGPGRHRVIRSVLESGAGLFEGTRTHLLLSERVGLSSTSVVPLLARCDDLGRMLRS